MGTPLRPPQLGLSQVTPEASSHLKPAQSHPKSMVTALWLPQIFIQNPRAFSQHVVNLAKAGSFLSGKQVPFWPSVGLAMVSRN